MFLALLSLFAALTSATVTDCGQGTSIFKLQDQSFSPEPPVATLPYDYWFTYTVPDGVTVEAGTSSYSVTLNGIPFPATKEDLCSQTSCPKTPGFYNESSTDIWPSGVSGKIVTTLKWFDTAGSLLLCSQTTERV